MKKFCSLLLVSIVILNGLSAQKFNSHDISGAWTGALSIQGSKLRIVFHFKQENGKITASLDSPDQGAKGIPVKEVTWVNDSLLVDVASIMGKYKAVLISDTSLQGTWYQGGISLPLNVTKRLTEVTKKVEVKSPFYDAVEVKIENKTANVTLAGTLTLPKGAKNCPAVVLVTGSGAQNRDEELMGQKPFFRIADYLSSHGIAVLRYDDRGVFESTGDFRSATSYDFATDAEAAFEFLRKRPEVDPKKVGIAGHSEGGLIAPMVASRNKNVGYIILLAGPGITGKEILVTQTEALLKIQGLKDDTIRQITELNKEVYRIVESQANDSLAAASVKDLIRKRHFSPEALQTMEHTMPTLLSPWFRAFISSDPSKYLSNVHCPVLALNGSKDLQVLPKENLAGIEKALKQAKNKNVELLELPGYNHLFQEAVTGAVSEYSNTVKPAMDDKVLDIISTWIKKL